MQLLHCCERQEVCLLSPHRPCFTQILLSERSLRYMITRHAWRAMDLLLSSSVSDAHFVCIRILMLPPCRKL